MSGSVSDTDVCGTDWEKWMPQNDLSHDKYNFTWKTPWKKMCIKICSNDNNILENTSEYLVPLKMQFLITHHLSTVQRIIRNTESSKVESINSTEELLTIKVKALDCEDMFTNIERALAAEIDDIVMKPIQRLNFTSNLVEELFQLELKEKSIDLMRDEKNIFIVGYEKMKSFITKHIDEINRITATKVVKLEDKWKIEAVKCLGITDTLSKTFSDVNVRVQEETSSVQLKGREATINKAETELHKLLSDLFNEKLYFDPLTLNLLNCQEASNLFKEILLKEHLQVVWTVDSTHLYLFSKTKINTDAVKAAVYGNFLIAGFSKSAPPGNLFCKSDDFSEITKQQTNKLLFLETTDASVNIAGTKSLVLHILQQEKLFYNDVGNTKEIQVTSMCTTPSGQTINTVVGDITELDVDVIVNAANKELQHVGGLAKVIVDKGGNSIQKECDDYVRSKNRARKMYEGEVFCSAPGNLNCKMIVHAVGPVWQNGRSSENEYLRECIEASLEKTEDMKYKSIAIPALCTGIFGYPPNKATQAIVESIRDYMKENGASSSVRQIYLSDVKKDTVSHFVSALERYFGKANIKKHSSSTGFVNKQR